MDRLEVRCDLRALIVAALWGHCPFTDLPNVCAPLSALGCRDPVVGRFMVAARDIEAGEVIFHDEPACIGESSLHTYCVYEKIWPDKLRRLRP